MNFKEFITKLQNLPEGRKKIILWTIVIILGLVMGFFWVKEAANSLPKIGESIKSVNLPLINLPDMNALQTTTNQTADWKIYTNNKYGFEIKYPSDWAFREYDTGEGAAFFSKDKANENATGNGFINVAFLGRGADYCKILFADYVKIAGPSEIQNYESLNTIEEGATDGGLTMYQATWNYKDMQAAEKISLPITYFETKPELCGDVEVFLNGGNYSDIYDQMLSTFKFIK